MGYLLLWAEGLAVALLALAIAARGAASGSILRTIGMSVEFLVCFFLSTWMRRTRGPRIDRSGKLFSGVTAAQA